MMTLSTQAVDDIGFVAAFCTTVAFVPQLVRVLKLRSAREISLGTFLLFSIGSAFCGCSTGSTRGSKPVIASNAVTLVLSREHSCAEAAVWTDDPRRRSGV